VDGWQQRVVSQSGDVWEGHMFVDVSLKRGVIKCMEKEVVAEGKQ
jgi:hypothetical protein